MQIRSLSKKIILSLSPQDAYSKLTEQGSKANTALLETAEAGSHAEQKSITAVSSALKIKGLNHKVVIEILNENGQAFIDSFDFASLANFEMRKLENKVELLYQQTGELVDEEQRLLQSSTLDVLKAIQNQLSESDGQASNSNFLIGAFSFDIVDQFEQLPQVEKVDEDYVFYLADQLLLQTINNHSAQIIVKGFGDYANNEIHLGQKIEVIEKKLQATVTETLESNVSTEYSVQVSDEEFCRQVGVAKEHICAGDAFQVVLSRGYQVACDHPLVAYQRLRATNPSPYMYYINFGDKQLFGASPESCLKVESNREISLYPIAGTRKRALHKGQLDYEKDAKVEFDLIQDQKEQAEHMMLVDLARNDLARVIQPKTRKITQLKRVVKYSHVMHMVSEVKGILRDDLTALDAYRACANMGTLTGAPKIKAAEIIRQQEQSARGFYGGAVALMNANGEFDSAIIIRSALVRDGVATITAGAGVVYDSVPELEAKETYNKAKAVIDACLNIKYPQETAA